MQPQSSLLASRSRTETGSLQRHTPGVSSPISLTGRPSDHPVGVGLRPLPTHDDQERPFTSGVLISLHPSSGSDWDSPCRRGRMRLTPTSRRRTRGASIRQKSRYERHKRSASPRSPFPRPVDKSVRALQRHFPDAIVPLAQMRPSLSLLISNCACDQAH